MADTVTNRWSVRDMALVFTVVVQLCAVVWWGSRITKSQESLAETVAELAANMQRLQAGQIDLQIRIAVQEAMAERERTTRGP